MSTDKDPDTDKVAEKIASRIADALADKVADKLLERLAKTRRKPFADFADSQPEDKNGDGLWAAYLEDALEEDATDSERWIGFTTGMFAFTGLFAATVAAFVVESYRLLRPDTNVQTVALLSQLVSASNISPVVPIPDLSEEVFPVPLRTAIVVNSLWFLALVISLVCALLTALIQEWGSDYLHDIRKPSREMTIRDYASYHIHVRMGIERFGMDNLMSFIITLMHAAVALFLIGLAMFLYPINHVPSFVVEAAGFATAALYVSFSIVPLFDNSIPSRTPLTHLLIALEWSISFVLLPALTLALLPLLSLVDDNHMSWWSYDGVSFIGTMLQLLLRELLPVQRYNVNGSLELARMADRSTPMKARHLIFMWQHSRGYMLVDHHSSILLDYLPRQLLVGNGAKTYSRFFTFLGHNPQVMERIRHIMSSVTTTEAGIGVLQLLHLFIPTELRASRALSPEWVALRRSGLPAEFPDIVKNLNELNKSALAVGDVTLFVELTRFRGSLAEIVTRPVAGTALPLVNDFTMKPLQVMLEQLHSVEGFRLLPLYSPETSSPNVTPAYATTSCQNIVTLLAILIAVQSGEAELQTQSRNSEAGADHQSSTSTLSMSIGSNGLLPKSYFDDLQKVKKSMSDWLWRDWYPKTTPSGPKPRASDIFSFLVDYALINERIIHEKYEFTAVQDESDEPMVTKEIIADILTHLVKLIDADKLHDMDARERGRQQLRDEFGLRIGEIEYLTLEQVAQKGIVLKENYEEQERRRIARRKMLLKAMHEQIQDLTSQMRAGSTEGDKVHNNVLGAKEEPSSSTSPSTQRADEGGSGSSNPEDKRKGVEVPEKTEDQHAPKDS
ncbi:unnamed protein product [Peniophora sp. CBMAI 1063]|nr:unnamed protein product [Peniophora sp. CBMAI 1063]